MVQADIVEVIPRIEGGVADKLKHTAMHSVRAGAGDDIGCNWRPPWPISAGHHAGAGLHFLDGVDIEVGKSRAAHFRVGGVGSVECEDGRATALAVHGKLLRKIRGAVVSVMVPAARSNNLLKSREFSGRLETSPAERCSPPLAC